MHSKPLRPVVFLDRDGTLNEEKGYLRNLDDLVLIKGAAAAVQKLNEANVAAILVSNQTGAARNFYPIEHIDNLHKRLQELLKQEGAQLDAIYYCPHLPQAENSQFAQECSCRKPGPGLIERALFEHQDLDRTRMFMVGDKTADLGLANAVHAKCILLETGYGREVIESKAHEQFRVDLIAPSVKEAVDWALAQVSGKVSGKV